MNNQYKPAACSDHANDITELASNTTVASKTRKLSFMSKSLERLLTMRKALMS